MASRCVRILPTAKRELESAIAWMSLRSTSAAASLSDAFENKVRELASGLVEYPLSHLSELAELGYRTCSFGSYVLLYYVDHDQATIAHVFHQRRNYASLVRSDKA